MITFTLNQLLLTCLSLTIVSIISAGFVIWKQQAIIKVQIEFHRKSLLRDLKNLEENLKKDIFLLEKQIDELKQKAI